MRRHNRWSAADTRRRMEQRRRGAEQAGKRDANPIVLLLCAALVISVGLSTFFWKEPQWVSFTSGSATRAGEFTCNVSSITDGDTLRCGDGTRVRLHAVAAREKDETCSPGHPCPAASAAAATDKLRALAGGQVLQCEATGTTYNRIAAICRNEAGVEINCAMVQSGTTLIWPKYNSERPICS